MDFVVERLFVTSNESESVRDDEYLVRDVVAVVAASATDGCC